MNRQPSRVKILETLSLGAAILVVSSLLAGAAAFATTREQTDVLNIHALPLGDGRISSYPQRGYVMSCMTEFRGGGARGSGPWIHGDTWDLTEKPAVQGQITWPQAQFEITTDANERVVSRIITGNGLPVETSTGIFPVGFDDPAFRFDRNPNSISSQNIALKLPMNPTLAESPSCVPMGMIGVALNGVAIFNALDAAGRDAVAHEVQDVCGGHPQQQGQYHYHGPSPCLPDETQHEKLIGYALDGFGIYSMYDAHGRELTDADLDECHGRTSEVEWNGERRSIYHYVLTREYPYTVGCFRGTPLHLRGPGGPGGGMRGFMAGLFGFPPPPAGSPPGPPPPP
ncbi:MAG TPA: YHYH protein [Candidatus Binataceae bacterium]|nr:YHYH protein [Candidatus Binataceae bacterium]